MQQVTVNDFNIGDSNGFVLIAGPCVIENEESALAIAR
jgi:3-deoxy-D-manno-octulosonic acid (KDO) 8-phosphate synthase